MKLGRCSFEGCKRRGRVKRECVACEKKDRKHEIVACGVHATWSLDTMKAHVVLKHPAVIPSLVVAALKGDDVF